MTLHHITLMTGHTTIHRLDTLDPYAIEVCRALLPNGGPVPMFPAFQVQIVEGAMFTLWRASEPILTCGVGEGGTSPDLWEALCKLQSQFAPVKVARPPAKHWLAVALLPGLLTQSQDDVGWLGDFERCLAAAMLLG
jgi:hypothetical protein